MALPSLPHSGGLNHSAPPNPRDDRIAVLVADPHCCVREGLKAMLDAQPDMRVIGAACDGPAALTLAAELDPDIVVLEASLPGLDGAQVVARMRAACNRKVLVLTACEH